MAKARAAADPVVSKIVDNAKEIHGKTVAGRKSTMKFPLRILSKVRYTPKTRLGDR